MKYEYNNLISGSPFGGSFVGKKLVWEFIYFFGACQQKATECPEVGHLNP